MIAYILSPSARFKQSVCRGSLISTYVYKYIYIYIYIYIYVYNIYIYIYIYISIPTWNHSQKSLAAEALKNDVYKPFAQKKIWWCWELLMFLKLWQCRIMCYLLVGFKTIILCSVLSIWFVKYAISAKIWFVKTTTRIVK